MNVSIPVVSVVMSVYNGAATLAEAIDSILNQTFTDFEFIIIDDGSTDNTPPILADYALRDERLVIVTQPNQGLTVSLNRGFDLARGQYMARMDADDLSLPERFERQVALLEAQPDIGVCGTAMRYFGSREGEIHFDSDPVTIHCSMLFQNPVAHPTAMLRKSVFDAHGLRYNPEYQRAQDYDLWMRAADVTNITNLPEVLLLYRTGESQISIRQRAEQLTFTRSIYTEKLRTAGIHPTLPDITAHDRLFAGDTPRNLAGLDAIDTWLRRLYDANQTLHFYPDAAFAQILAKRWYRCCRSCAPLGLRCWWRYIRSPLMRYLPVSMSAKLFGRCLLRKKA